ncbi:sensor histidine kinase [Spirosoma horti]
MKSCYLFCCFWVGILLPVFAQTAWPPVYEIKADSSIKIDTTHFQILEDRAGDFTFEQVQKDPNFRVEPAFDRHRRSHVYWVRMRIKNSLSDTLNLYLCDFASNYLDMYWLDTSNQWQHQRTGSLIPQSQLPDRKGNKERNRLFFRLLPGQQTTLYQRSERVFWWPPLTNVSTQLQTERQRVDALFNYIRVENGWESYFFDGIMIGILLLAVFYNLVVFFSIKDRVYLYFSISLFFFTLSRNQSRIQLAFFYEHPYEFELLAHFFFIIYFVFFIQSIRKFIQPIPAFSLLDKFISLFLWVTVLVDIGMFFSYTIAWVPPDVIEFSIEILIRVVYVLCTVLMVRMMKIGSIDARFALLATTPLFIFWLYTLTNRILGTYFGIDVSPQARMVSEYTENACFAWLIIFFSGALVNRYNLVRQRVAQQIVEREQMEKEQEMERIRLIESQKELLEQQVEERTAQLKTSLDNLRATQNQLVQKEKMASLGELTAGIAHEIQNPLNFVTNFSDVSVELLDELKEGLWQKLPDSEKEYAEEILGDLSVNLEKITYHGNRASSIVKGMLEHSRLSTGERKLTNLNALADEYLRLAYHGLRAKDKNFNCELVTHLDSGLPIVNVVTQDISRVLLNLFTNAFYAVSEKKQQLNESDLATYKPTVTVTTGYVNGRVEIHVLDNGTGMPDSVKAKIFQPFFTTKPAGSGTGLGLSLSYDIVTKGHGGSLTVDSTPGQSTEFTLTLIADEQPLVTL